MVGGPEDLPGIGIGITGSAKSKQSGLMNQSSEGDFGQPRKSESDAADLQNTHVSIDINDSA